MTIVGSDRVFASIPDPGCARTVEDLTSELRSLRIWAGEPSYNTIKDRINRGWLAAGRPPGELTTKATVADCFKSTRRRLRTDLVVGVVQALHPDPGYVAQWRQALRVVRGETTAAAQVRVQDGLPDDIPGFTGRALELGQLRQLLHRGQQDGDAVVIAAIAGMAGVGKTQLAIRAGRLVAGERPFRRVLFVDLRGFHPDPDQPPADPAAVLDAFLRLLGTAAHEIPHDPAARARAYRDRLAGTRTLVILDNAADEDQVRPLLPDVSGCVSLVTSRHQLAGLPGATHLTVNAFTAAEAVEFLGQATSGTPPGPDPEALARICVRCGHLPLALGLVAGHIRRTPGWTLTDHADRLDERQHAGRLDTGVQVALDLSYRHLPDDSRRLLRMLALHPGQDLDVFAAAALGGIGVPVARMDLTQLCEDHLLQRTTAGRYTFHDLVRAYAVNSAGDEDPPAERHAAVTRLFDHYCATTAAAMDVLHPAEAHHRPRICSASTSSPDFAGTDDARTWLDVERPTLVAVAAHAATRGWPVHATQLSGSLFRYLNGGYHHDALIVHGHAHRAALDIDDPIGQAHALTDLGITLLHLNRCGQATDHLRRALALYRKGDDRTGQARVLGNLGNIEYRLGNYQSAIDLLQKALPLFRHRGDQVGEAGALANLGNVRMRLGRYGPAIADLNQALTLLAQIGNVTGEAHALSNLGVVQLRLGWCAAAAASLEQALGLFRQLGDRAGEAEALNRLGALHLHLNRPGRAAALHEQALAIAQEIGDRQTEAWAFNGLGDVAHASNHPTLAIDHHTAADAIAVDIDDRHQQACARAGLGRAHRALGNHSAAREYLQQSLALYVDLGMPEAIRLRRLLQTAD